MAGLLIVSFSRSLLLRSSGIILCLLLILSLPTQGLSREMIEPILLASSELEGTIDHITMQDLKSAPHVLRVREHQEKSIIFAREPVLGIRLRDRGRIKSVSLRINNTEVKRLKDWVNRDEWRKGHIIYRPEDPPLENGMNTIEIFVTDIDGGKENRSWKLEVGLTIVVKESPLTTGTKQDWNPKWSPDGNRIAYETTGERVHEIWVMESTGEEKVRVVESAIGRSKKSSSFGLGKRKEEAASFGLSWAPDVSAMVFSSSKSGNYELWIADFTGREERPKLRQFTFDPAFDGEGDWSPAGDKIAFVSPRTGNGDIWVKDSDDWGSETLKRLTTNPGLDFTPKWSPDGLWIAYTSSKEDGDFDLYVMKGDGTERRNLTSNKKRTDERYPSWSPDGSNIAFYSDNALCLMRSDGRDFTVIDDNVEIPNVSEGPTWSPDGSKILYVSGRMYNPIYVADIAQGPKGGFSVRRPYQVVSADQSKENRELAWSPDGSKLVFRSFKSLNWDLWLAEVGGVKRRNGSFTISSTVPGAQVFLNDDRIGTIPAVFKKTRFGKTSYMIDDLQAGPKTLRISKYRYPDFEMRTMAVSNRNVSIIHHLPSPPRYDLESGIRSLLVPGFGQHYLGRKSKAATFLSLAAAGIIGTAISQIQANRAYSQYEQATTYRDLASSRGKANLSTFRRDLFLGLTVSVWTLNVLDALFETKEEPSVFREEEGYQERTTTIPCLQCKEGKGTLGIASNVGGAYVELRRSDGEEKEFALVGTTPLTTKGYGTLTVSDLEKGKYVVRISKPGYETYINYLDVKPGEKTISSIKMTKRSSVINRSKFLKSMLPGYIQITHGKKERGVGLIFAETASLIWALVEHRRAQSQYEKYENADDLSQLLRFKEDAARSRETRNALLLTGLFIYGYSVIDALFDVPAPRFKH